MFKLKLLILFKLENNNKRLLLKNKNLLLIVLQKIFQTLF